MTEMEFSKATIEELKNHYRFKTEEEFIDEFGKDFQHHTVIYFNRNSGCMSLLYGMPLNSSYLTISEKGTISMNVVDLRTKYATGWIVTYDMITRISHKSLNKQKVKDKDVSRCMFNIEV